MIYYINIIYIFVNDGDDGDDEDDDDNDDEDDNNDDDNTEYEMANDEMEDNNIN